jgi:hypothetical protein
MAALTEPHSNRGNDARQIKTEPVHNIAEAETEAGD